jgi:hypothetical protein
MDLPPIANPGIEQSGTDAQEERLLEEMYFSYLFFPLLNATPL